jgi:hypothetical protein
MDIRYVGDDFDIQFADFDRTSLYDAGATFLKSTAFGEMVCDRQGALYFEIGAEATNNAASSLNQSMFIDNHDWMGEPSITERYVEDISYLEGGGVAYTNYRNAGDGSFAAMMGAAPGTVPAYRGSNQKISGLALTNQNQLNTVLGNVWESRNSKYPEVMLDLVGNFRNLDIAPQEIVTLTVLDSDTNRGISWEQKAFTPRAMSWSYDAGKGLFLPSVTLAEVTQGNAGQTISIPAEPPSGGFDQPPIPLPPPVPPIPSLPPSGGINWFFVPAIGGVGTGAVLFNPNSRWSSPATIGDTGVGISMSPSNTTTAEGWCMFPYGATSLDIYCVVDLRNAAGGNYYVENRAIYGPCEVSSADINDVSTGNIEVPGTDAEHSCVAQLTISGNSGDIVQFLFQRLGADPLDTHSNVLHVYGWAVYAT